MWIKKALITLPISLLLFMAISYFFAPDNEAVANNEGRKDRIILYMGANPENMNPWMSTSSTDSTISSYFFEGLIRYDRMYDIEPWLAETVVVVHEIDAVVPIGMTAAGYEAKIREKYGDEVTSIVEGTVKFQLDDDAKESLKKDVTLAALLKFEEKLKSLKVLTIKFTKPEQEKKIVSAVKPSFGTDMKEMLSNKLGEGQIEILIDTLLGMHEELETKKKDELGSKMHKENAAKAKKDKDTKPVVPAKYEDMPDKAKKELSVQMFKKMLQANVKELGGLGIAHRPIVEMNLRKGAHWTDGPYFSEKDKTWVVMVGDDQAGILIEDSEADAIEAVREGLSLGEATVITAHNYKETFDGKNGAWWGKGPELTGRDPKITFDQIKLPTYASPRMSSYESIKNVIWSDKTPYKIEVVYGKLYSPALTDLMGNIMPHHRWNNTAWEWEATKKGLGWKDLRIDREKYDPMAHLNSDDRDFRLRPSYLGSMVLEPLNGKDTPYWQGNSKVMLRKNEFYWGRQAEYTFVEYLIFDPQLGSETSEAVFQTGGMDSYGAKDYQVKRYEEQEDKYYIIKRQPTTYSYLGFNQKRDVLSDKRVRLALSMAVNVDEIIEYVVYGQGERITGPAYPVLPWYNKDYEFEHKWRSGPKKGQTEMLKKVPFNLDEASALLAEVGYKISGGVLKKGGKPLKLDFANSTGNPTRTSIADLARANWTLLGADVRYKEYEWNDFIGQRIMPMDFDICVLAWSGGLDFDKRQLWHSKYSPPNGLNFCNYANPEADKLMDEILTVYDQKKQVEMSHQLFDLIAADFPYIFLFSAYSTTVVDRHIVWRKKDGKGGLVDRPLDDKFIKESKSSWRFFEPELVHRDKLPDFKD